MDRVFGWSTILAVGLVIGGVFPMFGQWAGFLIIALIAIIVLAETAYELLVRAGHSSRPLSSSSFSRESSPLADDCGHPECLNERTRVLIHSSSSATATRSAGSAG